MLLDESEEKYKLEKNNKSYAWVFVTAVLVCIAIIGGVVAWYFNHKKTNNEQNEAKSRQAEIDEKSRDADRIIKQIYDEDNATSKEINQHITELEELVSQNNLDDYTDDVKEAEDYLKQIKTVESVADLCDDVYNSCKAADFTELHDTIASITDERAMKVLLNLYREDLSGIAQRFILKNTFETCETKLSKKDTSAEPQYVFYYDDESYIEARENSNVVHTTGVRKTGKKTPVPDIVRVPYVSSLEKAISGIYDNGGTAFGILYDRGYSSDSLTAVWYTEVSAEPFVTEKSPCDLKYKIIVSVDNGSSDEEIVTPEEITDYVSECGELEIFKPSPTKKVPADDGSDENSAHAADGQYEQVDGMNDIFYRVKAPDGKQKAAYNNLNMAKKFADANKSLGYVVYDNSGKMVYDPSAN